MNEIKIEETEGKRIYLRILLIIKYANQIFFKNEPLF
jgi:hypothetical protein